ncbi:hypothetical protein [uncultured Ruegeria sp.]|uniref:hypothetical protein n=1 Tax=uncultured Ruegeria sp. TaxID=259304 RepID=UPI0026339243|nr:hypothetical protein [uncultured Ruegeria sp.]
MCQKLSNSSASARLLTKSEVSKAFWGAFTDLKSEGYRVSGFGTDETDAMTLADALQTRLFPDTDEDRALEYIGEDLCARVSKDLGEPT